MNLRPSFEVNTLFTLTYHFLLAFNKKVFFHVFSLFPVYTVYIHTFNTTVNIYIHIHTVKRLNRVLLTVQNINLSINMK